MHVSYLKARLVILVCSRKSGPLLELVPASIEDATADALADLPIDALRSFVERRPLTTTALAMLLGYSVVRHPQMAQRHAERFFMSML